MKVQSSVAKRNFESPLTKDGVGGILPMFTCGIYYYMTAEIRRDVRVV